MAVIASINGREWVLGLHWISYERAPKRAELVKDSNELDAPWYSLRVTDEVVQAGFCKPVNDIARPKKMASLAAMLADAKPQPWLGVFELAPDVFWYVAVRDGYAILPAGDIVGSQEAIAHARAEHAGFGGWNFVQGDLNTLEELLQEVQAKRTPVRSLAVSRLNPIPTAIAAAVVVLLASAAGVAHHYYAAADLAKRRADFMAKHSNSTAKARVPTPSELMAKSAKPSAWLDACGSVLEEVDTSVDGWVVSSTSCGDGSATVRRTRGAGATVADIPPGMSLDDVGNSGVQHIAFPVGASDGAPAEPVADQKTARLALIAWGQKYGVQITFRPPEPIAAENNTGWKIPVTIPMPLSPFTPGHGLDAIPGLRIVAVDPSNATQAPAGDAAANANQGAWTLTGVLYAR